MLNPNYKVYKQRNNWTHDTGKSNEHEYSPKPK